MAIPLHLAAATMMASADDAGHVRVYDWPSTTTYTAGVSQLDFNDLDLVSGDRVIINVTGGSQVEAFMESSGLDGLLSNYQRSNCSADQSV